ncbi:hypothetical protein ABB37_05650 [Leptomonas pyrrhocoris]|uniref:Uncharacterized protein n=1 Tax=Leptomonas pyrrhocoris TaxID=157538 RepID=A0A0N0DUM5_LEPPY|nr:hypothetical protein ABB37_05650 [Leptomonas pyrrhocoris]KPA79142.1 hypothetical protein ABB37_05650 [Leptomonas pyrrhocoris]|eukprot:XP_015657581.1 hypothetical protein ABB37_05650 [Leptomonas pyrrhocoris]
MSSSLTSSPCGWNAVVNLSDADFTSRVDFIDAYVLPTFSEVAPTAALVSPWLLSYPPPLPPYPTTANSDLQRDPTHTTACASAASPHARVETVPLAWRCPTCGSVEVEQLYWRRPSAPRCCRTAHNVSTTATRALLARKLQLQGLSAAMKAKLERHRRRRERREEMRWRSLHVSTRCRQCFLCPRCGGHGGSEPCETQRDAEEARVTSPNNNPNRGASCCRPSYRNDRRDSGDGGALAPASSVSALDIRLTNDMRYFAVCPCCEWHSYQAFPSMEQLISYLDSVMGEDKTEVMRDRRNSQRSANSALRSRLHEILCPNDAAGDVGEELLCLLPHEPPKMSLSHAAWETYTKLTSGRQRRTSPNSPRGDATPRQRHKEGEKKSINTTAAAGDEEGEDAVDLVAGLHPAVALEVLREREAVHRAKVPLDKQAVCAPPGAVQVARVWDLAQEAWAFFGGADQPDTIEAAPSLSVHPPGSSEVDFIARTQQSVMGLCAEAVDTRQLTLHEWMQRYQPAAVVAQQRKAAAAATATSSPTRHAILRTNGSSPSALAALFSTLPGRTPAKIRATTIEPAFATPTPTSNVILSGSTPAATPTVSALYHTPTSAYLQSLLQREHDRPLGLPAYCVPRGRKELLTGLAWRLPSRQRESGGEAADDDDGADVHCHRVPCTRVVLLDRPALSESEVQLVYAHWSVLLEKAAERQRQLSTQEMTTAAGGDGGSDSEADEDNVDGLLATSHNDASSEVIRNSGAETSSVPPSHVALSAATTFTSPSPPPSQKVSANKKKTTTLPLPLFLDGTGYAATSALPCWQYVGSTRTGSHGKAYLEWRFRLVNLNLQHDLYVTTLAVSDVSVRRGLQTASSDEGVDSSGGASSCELLLSSVGAPTVQLPASLQPRCSPEERAVLEEIRASVASRTTETAMGEDAARANAAVPWEAAAVLAPSPSPQLSAGGVAQLPELQVTLRARAEGLESKTRDSAVYVALAMEVLTPLPDVSTLNPVGNAVASVKGVPPCVCQYYSLKCGVTVLLTST